MDDKRIVIQIRLNKELKDRFQSICKTKAINSSELIRQLIEKWCMDQDQGYNRRQTDLNNL